LLSRVRCLSWVGYQGVELVINEQVEAWLRLRKTYVSLISPIYFNSKQGKL
jgi:hypothetical protein